MMRRLIIVCMCLICSSTGHAEVDTSFESSSQDKNSNRKAATANNSKNRATPATPEAWLAQMMDPTRNGLAAKNPELFAEWLNAVTEPRFMTALASIAMSPDVYAKSVGKMTDPATFRNWSEFSDPQIYLRWMSAGIDPRFYQAIVNRLTDSGKLERWGLYRGGLAPANFDAESGLANRPAGQAGQEKVAVPTQDWIYLPTHSPQTPSHPGNTAPGNPWLSNNANYRY